MVGRRCGSMSGALAGETALSQITENRKVDPHKPLNFHHSIFRFCLSKTILRQSQRRHQLRGADHRGLTRENPHSPGFRGRRSASEGEGCSRLDFPLVHDV